jgi:hypothetical protein
MLAGQVLQLQKEFRGPFPYADCKKLWQQIQEDYLQEAGRYEDLIPDLDSYFYIVDAHASGVEELVTWDGIKMVHARGLLKNSFYQMHTRYKPIESMINQINTPTLYEKVAISNQLRAMLLTIIADQMLNQNRLNLARQERFLTLNA